MNLFDNARLFTYEKLLSGINLNNKDLFLKKVRQSLESKFTEIQTKISDKILSNFLVMSIENEKIIKYKENDYLKISVYVLFEDNTGFVAHKASVLCSVYDVIKEFILDSIKENNNA